MCLKQRGFLLRGWYRLLMALRVPLMQWVHAASGADRAGHAAFHSGNPALVAALPPAGAVDAVAGFSRPVDYTASAIASAAVAAAAAAAAAAVPVAAPAVAAVFPVAAAGASLVVADHTPAACVVRVAHASGCSANVAAGILPEHPAAA